MRATKQITSRRTFLKGVLATLVLYHLPTPKVQSKLGFAKGIRYRKPHIPKKLPRTHTPRRIPRSPKAPTTGKNKTIAAIKKRNVKKAIAALKVRNSTARTQLRTALNTGQKGVKSGRSWNAHHMVYWSERNHPTLLKAAKGGFNINSKANGLRIPTSIHKQVHSNLSDQHNRKQIKSLLNKLEQKKHYTPEQTAIVLGNNIRHWKYQVMEKKPLIASFNDEIRNKS